MSAEDSSDFRLKVAALCGLAMLFVGTCLASDARLSKSHDGKPVIKKHTSRVVSGAILALAGCATSIVAARRFEK